MQSLHQVRTRLENNWDIGFMAYTGENSFWCSASQCRETYMHRFHLCLEDISVMYGILDAYLAKDPYDKTLLALQSSCQFKEEEIKKVFEENAKKQLEE